MKQQKFTQPAKTFTHSGPDGEPFHWKDKSTRQVSAKISLQPALALLSVVSENFPTKQKRPGFRPVSCPQVGWVGVTAASQPLNRWQHKAPGANRSGARRNANGSGRRAAR